MRLDDIDEVAALFRRRDEGLGLHPEPVHAFLGWMLRLPFVDLERDTTVLERDGAIVASLTSFRDPALPGAYLASEGAVDPAMRGQRLGAWLLARLDAVVADRADELPFDVHALVPSVDRAGNELLGAHGFAMVRVNHEMAIDLAAARRTFEPPPDVTLRTFEEGRDERAMWETHQLAFVDHFGFTPMPYESWEKEWYASDDWDPSHVVIAEVDGSPAGHVGWVDADPDGYIVDVSMLPAFRGRGIAKSLLSRAFDDIAAAGKRRATLTVDTENTTGAVGLYEAVGMLPYRAWHVFARHAT
jgi:ribosomal protein S18 acetylase RimI-like enzyme